MSAPTLAALRLLAARCAGMEKPSSVPPRSACSRVDTRMYDTARLGVRAWLIAAKGSEAPRGSMDAGPPPPALSSVPPRELTPPDHAAPSVLAALLPLMTTSSHALFDLFDHVLNLLTLSWTEESSQADAWSRKAPRDLR